MGRKMSKETKGIHPEPSETSLIRDLKKENIKLRSLCRKAAEQVIDDHKETLQKLADNPYPYKHLKEDCVAYQEGGMGCPDCYCDASCKDNSCHICGGNTPERVEEQIEWLEKIAKQKEKRMKPEIKDTDIIIRRAANGWIVFSGSEYEEGHFMTTVYEDTGTEWGEQEALIGLIREHFSMYTQSKKQGGIKLEVREKGYSFEEDEEEDV